MNSEKKNKNFSLYRLLNQTIINCLELRWLLKKVIRFPPKEAEYEEFRLACELDKEVKTKLEEIMELIPIIKLALVIFATVVFFIVLISYMIYKAKEKMQGQSKNQNRKANVADRKQPVANKEESVFIKNNYSDHANKEQIYFVPQKQAIRVPVLAHSQPRSKERFKVVNNQTTNYKIYETRVEKPRAFYHPSSQSVNSYAFRSPKGNILDNYSLPNEPLRKLALK